MRADDVQRKREAHFGRERNVSVHRCTSPTFVALDRKQQMALLRSLFGLLFLILGSVLARDDQSSYDVEATAIITETRNDPNLINVVHQALTILPRNWHVIVFHSGTNEIPLRLGLVGADFSRLSLVRMEHDMANGNEPAGSFTLWYFTSNRMMTFQTDGAFCAGAEVNRTLQLAMQFDFVGPRWKEPERMTMHGQGANGGFSLRSKPACLDLLRTYPFHKYVKWAEQRATDTVHARGDGAETVHTGVFSLNEDAYYSMLLHLVNGSIAPAHAAGAWAVEAVWDGVTTPLAVHAPWFHMTLSRLSALMRACPAAATPYFDTMAKHVGKQREADIAAETRARGGRPTGAEGPRPNSDDFLESTFDAVARKAQGAGEAKIRASRLGWLPEPGHFVLRG